MVSKLKLIVRMPNWIGDAVMATPILQDLRQNYPHAEITVLASDPIAVLLANNTFLNQISRSKLWLPILAIVFVFLGSIFRLSGRDDVGNIYISISLIIILIVFPVSWLSRLILSGQLSHILRGEQRLDKLFSIQNIQVFLISPSNPIRWFLNYYRLSWFFLSSFTFCRYFFSIYCHSFFPILVDKVFFF